LTRARAELDAARAELEVARRQGEGRASGTPSPTPGTPAQHGDTGAAAQLERTQRELWAARAIARNGLSLDDAEWLSGGTEEEVEAAAARFAARTAARPAPPGVLPRARLVPGGSDPTGQIEETDPRKLAGRIPRQ
jgi:hypothetical protein